MITPPSLFNNQKISSRGVLTEIRCTPEGYLLVAEGIFYDKNDDRNWVRREHGQIVPRRIPAEGVTRHVTNGFLYSDNTGNKNTFLGGVGESPERFRGPSCRPWLAQGWRNPQKFQSSLRDGLMMAQAERCLI